MTDVQGGLFEVIEISFHDTVAFDQDTAILAKCAFLAGFVIFDAYLNTRDRFADTAGPLNCGVFVEMTGEHSVAPYPSRTVILCLFLNPSRSASGHLSAPVRAMRKVSKSPFSDFRRYPQKKGGRADQTCCLMVSGDGTHLLEIEWIGVSEHGHAK